MGEQAVDAFECLGSAMARDEVRLEPLAETHREALKAACAEDLDIWPIYATSFDPDHFDASFDLLGAMRDESDDDVRALRDGPMSATGASSSNTFVP